MFQLVIGRKIHFAFFKNIFVVFDNFSVIEDIGGVRVNVILWDTAGQGIVFHFKKNAIFFFHQTSL